jgi:NYN domain
VRSAGPRILGYRHEGRRRVIRPLVDWLDYNGYAVRTKPAKEHDDGEGGRRVKRNIGVELAVDALEIARRIDHAFLLSGDGDLRAVTERVQRLGVRVTVVSSVRTKLPLIADELRRQADVFLEVDTLRALSSVRRTQSADARLLNELSLVIGIEAKALPSTPLIWRGKENPTQSPRQAILGIAGGGLKSSNECEAHVRLNGSSRNCPRAAYRSPGWIAATALPPTVSSLIPRPGRPAAGFALPPRSLNEV